jgi:hypothetical protein
MEAVGAALFSTNHEQDVQDLPGRNKHILGITSLWMAIPICNGVLTLHDTWKGGTVALTFVLTLVCLASTMFWSDPRGDSFWHKADKALAWIFGIAMVWCTVLPGDGRNLDNITFASIVFSILFFFLLSDVFFRKKMGDLQLATHLLFRFAFYWWSHLLLVPAETYFWPGFLVMTLGYFGHILVLYKVLGPMTGVAHQTWYWGSARALLFWIYFCAVAHTKVSYAPHS